MEIDETWNLYCYRKPETYTAIAMKTNPKLILYCYNNETFNSTYKAIETK